LGLVSLPTKDGNATLIALTTRVTDLAAKQHGLIARHQSLAMGMTVGQVQQCVTAGRWQSFMPGVYRVRGAPVTWHMKLLGACLSTSGVASHRSAAVLNDVHDFRPGMPEVSVLRHRGRARTDIRVHESKDLHLITPVWLQGIPTTPTSRLAVDLGAVVPFERYESAMHDLIARNKLRWEDSMEALFRHSKQGRNGCGPLRALLDEQYGRDIAESVLERRFIDHFTHLTIPRPVMQYEVLDGAEFVARVDFAYPDKKIAIELDSRRFHLNPDGFENDKRKRNRLTLMGWFVYEVTWKMLLHRPHVVFAQIEQAYRTR